MKKLLTYYKITIDLNQKNKALNLILQNNFTFKSTKILSKSFEITISKSQVIDYRELFEKNNISARFEEIKGLLTPVLLLKKRAGLMIGAIFLIIVLLFSSKVVWKIEIEGNSCISDGEILKELEAAGLTLGSYVPKIDYDSLHNKILLNSKNLSWVSVNIVGNVAMVKVKENSTEKINKESAYTNVVAKYDGYIDSIIINAGNKVVKIGDVVKKGDILISGIIDSQAQGVRYEHASGVINAYVNKEITVKIPLNSTKKIYTGNVYINKKYKLYNFPIKFLTKYNNYEGFYDTIEKKELLCLMGISNLPLEVTTTTYYEYRLIDINYTVSQAANLAKIELSERQNACLANAQLISKKIIESYDENFYYITCELYCLENIAEEKEIYLE